MWCEVWSKTEGEVEGDGARVEDVFRFPAEHQGCSSAEFHRPLECGLRSHNAGFVPLPFRAESCGKNLLKAIDNLTTNQHICGFWMVGTGKKLIAVSCELLFNITFGDETLMSCPWEKTSRLTEMKSLMSWS